MGTYKRCIFTKNHALVKNFYNAFHENMTKSLVAESR